MVAKRHQPERRVLMLGRKLIEKRANPGANNRRVNPIDSKGGELIRFLWRAFHDAIAQ